MISSKLSFDRFFRYINEKGRTTVSIFPEHRNLFLKRDQYSLLRQDSSSKGRTAKLLDLLHLTISQHTCFRRLGDWHQLRFETLTRIYLFYRPPRPCPTKSGSNWLLNIFKNWVHLHRTQDWLLCTMKNTSWDRMRDFGRFKKIEKKVLIAVDAQMTKKLSI